MGYFTEKENIMLRPLAFIFGLGLLLIGVFGLTDKYMVSGNLFGIFRMNFEGHVIHVAGGVLGILTSVYSTSASKMFFIFVGLVATLFAVFGFIQEGDMLFGMFANNQADTIAHAIIAIISLTLGFSRS